MKMNELIKQIKSKKTLANLDDAFIRFQLIRYFTQNPQLKQKLDKKKIRTKVIKDVRAMLHKAYGMFITKDYFRKDKLADITALLKAHKSTAERIAIYPVLYKELFSITGKPNSILDLGCGFNPLSYKYMGLDKVDYHAYDISQADLEFLKTKLADEKGLKLITKISNLLVEQDFPATNVCFMFKLLNHIDLSNHHKESERLLTLVKSKWIIISFPLVTVSGKPINFKQNNWLKLMVERNGWRFVKRFVLGNEEFFVVEKGFCDK